MQEKHRILRELGEDSCATMGNGRNDLLMCRDAALSVAVIGRKALMAVYSLMRMCALLP